MRDANQGLKGQRHFPDTPAVQLAAESLEAMGWLRRVIEPERQAGQAGRPPSTRYVLHPRVRESSPVSPKTPAEEGFGGNGGGFRAPHASGAAQVAARDRAPTRGEWQVFAGAMRGLLDQHESSNGARVQPTA